MIRVALCILSVASIADAPQCPPPPPPGMLCVSVPEHDAAYYRELFAELNKIADSSPVITQHVLEYARVQQLLATRCGST